MGWFSKYPNWLYRESNLLSSSSIYKETCQAINRTFVSAGEILVHKEKTEYYPILIVYPDATPYIVPEIYILQKLPDKDTLQEYSFLSPDEIRKNVQNNIRFFNRRHQNPDGSICFVEYGDLQKEKAEIFSIDDIIHRLRIWLSGRIPKDSTEVELFLHFKNRYNKIQFLLPDTFFDTEIVKGMFLAGLTQLIQKNMFYNEFWGKIFVGICLIGENKSGVILPPKIYDKKEQILFTELPADIIEFIKGNKSETVQKYLDDEKIIEGYWWDINKEPQPFDSIDMLAEYVGNGDKGKGISNLIKSLSIPLKNLKEAIHLGIRFPGRARGKEWQMFRLQKGGRIPLVLTNDKELSERLADYSIQAIHQEYLTEDYFHMRNSGRADRNILKNTKISVIGCGAVGSEIADCLGKAGIGYLHLVDREELRAHNVVRHCLGINAVGYPKVLPMAAHIISHNPFVNVTIEGINILSSDSEKYLLEGFAGISSIADDNIESYLNEVAIEKNIMMFYCRALRGGKAGRIFRVIPHRDACKCCLSLYSREKRSAFIDIEEDKSLPVLSNECNNPVRPASGADLKIIASLAARAMIDFFHGKGTEINHWIWTTESLDRIKLKPLKTNVCFNTDFIPPHPKCPVCQLLKDKKILVRKDAYVLMKKEAAKSQTLETGGVLIGYITNDGEYIVLRATEPGPNAIRTETFFEKDVEYCQAQLEKAFSEYGNKGLYLGEWHYHPQGTNSPSGLDVKSLTQIASEDNYRIDYPIMIILSPKLEFAITIHDKNGKYTTSSFKAEK